MGKSEGIMNSMLRFSLLVMIPVAVVAYSSGSSYASGSSASPTPAPTPAPTAGTVTAHVISSTISLAGVTVAMFSEGTKAGKAARKAFKNTVASSLKLCGAAGTSPCTGNDVVIVSVTAARRAGAKIDFYVKVKDAAKAAAGATTPNTFQLPHRHQPKSPASRAMRHFRSPAWRSWPWLCASKQSTEGRLWNQHFHAQ